MNFALNLLSWQQILSSGKYTVKYFSLNSDLAQFSIDCL